MLIESFIHRCSVNIYVRMRCNHTFNTFWCCNEEQTDDFFASSFLAQDAKSSTSAGRMTQAALDHGCPNW